MAIKPRTNRPPKHVATMSGAQKRSLIRAARQSSGESTTPDRTVRHTAASSGDAAEAPSIFVCYAREDMAVVEAFINHLRNAGAGVTWDQDFPAGADIDRIIRDAIRTVQAVIVVWSTSSAQSHFVRDEARRAFNAAKLITIHVADFDPDNEVPVGFGQLNTVPLDDLAMVRRSLATHGVELRAPYEIRPE